MASCQPGKATCTDEQEGPAALALHTPRALVLHQLAPSITQTNSTAGNANLLHHTNAIRGAWVTQCAYTKSYFFEAFVPMQKPGAGGNTCRQETAGEAHEQFPSRRIVAQCSAYRDASREQGVVGAEERGEHTEPQNKPSIPTKGGRSLRPCKSRAAPLLRMATPVTFGGATAAHAQRTRLCRKLCTAVLQFFVYARPEFTIVSQQPHEQLAGGGVQTAHQGAPKSAAAASMWCQQRVSDGEQIYFRLPPKNRKRLQLQVAPSLALTSRRPWRLLLRRYSLCSSL